MRNTTASPASRRRGLKLGRDALRPIAPGEILNEEFLKPLSITQNALARAIDVPPARINDLVHNRRAITIDTAVRLAIYFQTSVEFWVNLQAQYEARVARRELQPRLALTIRPYRAA